jgi:hypothetical protein
VPHHVSQSELDDEAEGEAFYSAEKEGSEGGDEQGECTGPVDVAGRECAWNALSRMASAAPLVSSAAVRRR